MRRATFAFGEGIHGALGTGSRKSILTSPHELKIDALRVFAGWYVSNLSCAANASRATTHTHTTGVTAHSWTMRTRYIFRVDTLDLDKLLILVR